MKSDLCGRRVSPRPGGHPSPSGVTCPERRSVFWRKTINPANQNPGAGLGLVLLPFGPETEGP
jgi:hypothetical protein